MLARFGFAEGLILAIVSDPSARQSGREISQSVLPGAPALGFRKKKKRIKKKMLRSILYSAYVSHQGSQSVKGTVVG
jgi:hypothetical protein